MAALKVPKSTDVADKESEKLAIQSVKEVARLIPIQAPYFSAGSVMIQATGNDFVLVYRRPVPIQPGDNGELHNVMLNEAVAIITVSPQTAKDIALSLSHAIKEYEKEYGEIVTPYTKSKEQKASEGRKKSH